MLLFKSENRIGLSGNDIYSYAPLDNKDTVWEMRS